MAGKGPYSGVYTYQDGHTHATPLAGKPNKPRLFKTARETHH